MRFARTKALLRSDAGHVLLPLTHRKLYCAVFVADIYLFTYLNVYSVLRIAAGSKLNNGTRRMYRAQSERVIKSALGQAPSRCFIMNMCRPVG